MTTYLSKSVCLFEQHCFEPSPPAGDCAAYTANTRTNYNDSGDGSHEVQSGGPGGLALVFFEFLKIST